MTEDNIAQFLEYKHYLSNKLQKINKSLYEQEPVIKNIPRNPERTAGLRKLLEAKDCIVRAAIAK